MSQKRSSEEERNHLLKKIRKLERKIIRLPESDCEDDVEIDECQSYNKENMPTPLPEDEFVENPCEENLDQEDSNLDEEILNVLGVAPAPLPKKEILHKEVADRWTKILSRGLDKEEREPLHKDNIEFQNVPKMIAPKLNKEVAAAMNEGARKRDQVIENRQKQISTALSCIGQALQMALQNIQENKISIIKKMNDAGRLLCDSLFLDSRGRRTLVLSTINKDLKDSLLETEAGEFLFGENLTEKIKTAKAVQKSGKDLKSDDKKKPFVKQNENKDKTNNNKTLNWRGPPRAGIQQRSQRSGGQPYHRYNKHQSAVKKEDQTTMRRGRK
ncbi:uncharacterized protein LOC132903258 isoform X1 [Amyelois transitella]|uniref:uncharacterized protein LOC132903131 n=1 Tax=Amyelois transitella TaxID=680683 RepID=UPI00298F4F85|nr:uncharacterized protein LOC132903131 [Amyelois transitella]XP_060806498.1 uncharacterized protein LOC132903131 [Amyelois transitella]XP_060806989.1 uncharacterized protein LOC132903258 isoform X1 [Amyelois transitella]XP_060806990.1 uncharacterized protein LOC132903258 isoform X1 [Amyelois transitella]